jgi:hypothetical protein
MRTVKQWADYIRKSKSIRKTTIKLEGCNLIYKADDYYFAMGVTRGYKTLPNLQKAIDRR